MGSGKNIDAKRLAEEVYTLSNNGKDAGKIVLLLNKTFLLLKKASGSEVFGKVLFYLADLYQGKMAKEAFVTLPVPLTVDQKQTIIKYLENKFGGSFKITENVESTMGGGIKIIYEDFVLDLTLEDKIKELFR